MEFTSQPTARQLTLRAVMRTVLDKGPVSRTELSRLTGLSKQTMSEVFRDLESDGWLHVTGRTTGAVGRSAATYGVVPQRALVFGADFDGTWIRAALADMTGALVAETLEPTDRRGGEHVIAQITAVCASLAEEADVPHDRIVAGAVGAPGAYDRRTGRMSMVSGIPGFDGLPLRALLTDRLGFPVDIGNGVNMAAKGEHWAGEGRDTDTFVFIALGAGIGMGIINDGKILSGARGAAGKIATLPVGADPFDSRTFKSGALETMVGSAAIKNRYESAGGKAGLSVREIILAGADGDMIADATLTEVARNIAVAILAVCGVVDPERIVIGGSIGARSEILDRVRKALPLCMPAPPTCTIGTLGSRAGLYGAISISLESLRENLFSARVPGADRGAVKMSA